MHFGGPEAKAMLEGLEQYAREFGVELSPAQGAALRAYWRMVLETNRHTNLTRITEDRDATLKHFVDSLTVLKTGVFERGARVVDVGSGAGFPGVPLKIARPDLSMVLLDATLKRVRFLQAVIERLGLEGMEAVHGRAEELGRRPGWAGSFDVAVARAVARLDVLVRWCMPLVKPNGCLLAMKGPDVEEELAAAERALRAARARVVRVERLALPKGAGQRNIVVVEKSAAAG